MGVLARRGSLLRPNTPFVITDLTLSLWLKGDGVLWQDSARTTGAAADADPVGCWDDSTVNARNATQATAGQRPLLKTGANGLNGLPVVRFDGTDDRLIGTIDAAAAQTLFIVTKKRNAIAATNTPFSFDVNASGGQFHSGTGAAVFRWFATEAGGTTNLVGTPTSWNIMAITVASNASLRVRANGGAGVSFDPRDLSAVTAIAIGANKSGATVNGFADYDVAEIVRVSSELTVSQHNDVGYYLAHKYALPWAVAT